MQAVRKLLYVRCSYVLRHRDVMCMYFGTYLRMVIHTSQRLTPRGLIFVFAKTAFGRENDAISMDFDGFSENICTLTKSRIE